jgi:ADP-heptose:LPS heptosyltransferase
MPSPLFLSVRVPTLLAIFCRRHIRRQTNQGSAHRESPSYVVFRLDALGDVVLTTPLFRALKTAHPKSRLTVVVQRSYKALLATNRYIDEILTPPKIRPQWLPKRLQRLIAASLVYWRNLRGRHFDFAVSPRWDVDEHLATFLCTLTNATHRAGFTCTTTGLKRKVNRGFDLAYDICLPPGPICHEVDRNLAVAERLGAAVRADGPEIHLTERDRRAAANFLANVRTGTTLIALGIGARSPGRRWPLQRFAETVQQMGKGRKFQAVIVCSANEIGEASKLAALLQVAPIVIAGAMLREVCAVLERCEIFIGNDSGCAHLAAAVGCSTIVVSRHPSAGDPNHFNSPVRFAPYATNVRVLQPASGRDKCRLACIEPGPHCILGVNVDDVTSVALHMLGSQPRATVIQPNSRALLPPVSLLQTHSADAMRRAVEALRADISRPSL